MKRNLLPYRFIPLLVATKREYEKTSGIITDEQVTEMDILFFLNDNIELA